MQRIIGIRPRVKKTRDGEARPTQMLVFECGPDGLPLEKAPVKHELASDQDELDFLFRRYPTSWITLAKWLEREAADGKTPPWMPERHFKWRKQKAGEDLSDYGENYTRRDGKTVEVVSQVAATFDGFSTGDRVAMILGGSGDSLAGALAAQGRKIGAEVFRIPAIVLKKFRDERGASKDDDAKLLAELFAANPGQFYRVDEQDRAAIFVRECYRARNDAMKARIACQQRMDDLLRQQAYRELDPSRSLQEQFDDARANDLILGALEAAEAGRDRELLRALKQLPVFVKVVERIEGLGPSIGARLVAEVMDIRRFEVRPDQAAIDDSYRRSDHYKMMGRFKEDRGEVDVPEEGNGTREYRELVALAALKRQQGKHAEADYLDKAVHEHAFRAKLRMDSRRRSANKLVAYLGAHVLEDGTFPRRRRGGVSNWSPDGRQGLFLFGEQLNYRKNSEWGKYMLRMKEEQRKHHPEEITVSSSLSVLFRAIERYFGGGFGLRLVPNGASVTSTDDLLAFIKQGREALSARGALSGQVPAKLDAFLAEVAGARADKKTVKLYTPAHILRMAIWRTVTVFVVDFYHKWEQVDRQARRSKTPMSAAAE